ncbi:hypothetical protein [Bacteroides intestinalis]|jgi:hypothetical protein|uniref:Uncharacterized protein n=1 Tax=Bacteroides intestinalis TaxID=329854 RepID=A0AAQ0LIT7_9BACE|nr:hypothetical protein [Bacteroides intestinalis]QDO70444.1 hypothetical protein DXK01_016680 [Bacteroides intestinalis]RGT44413.1 hypothetical protein DWX27_22935 [Bacteroides intestinalis]UCB34630.1 hypothetical protein I1225_16560 [Bacteroides intestinalis]UCB38872.1 hypothetical protein I1224_16570 [Bacteroides intestinalis]
MKQLFTLIFTLAILSLNLVSCITLPPPPAPYAFAGIFDYSPLTSKGVFVTESNSVSFDYETIGSLYAISDGGWINNIYVEPSLDALYNEVLKQLDAYNANGIVNLKINVSGTIADRTKRYSLEGMAIRKTDAGKIDAQVSTARRMIGKIDGIFLQILEAYPNGTRVLTSEKMNTSQLQKAWKKYFYNQSQIQFYTSGGLVNKTAYAAIIDKKIMDYDTNEFIPLK